MKIKDIIFYSLFVVILPAVLYFGFFFTYLIEKVFITPQYKIYNLPLRTDFLEGCKIYATENIKLYESCVDENKTIITKQTSIKKITDWLACKDYKNYLEGINNLTGGD
jgi:hypothetical protein